MDLDGAVIGINNMKALAADGVSFAIPIDAVRGLVCAMMTLAAWIFCTCRYHL